MSELKNILSQSPVDLEELARYCRSKQLDVAWVSELVDLHERSLEKSDTKEGITLLHSACAFSKCKPDFVKLLIDEGFDVNGKAVGCLSPLWLALQSGNPDAARLLIAGGANVEWTTDTGITLMFAALKPFEPGDSICRNSVEVLLDAGVDANAVVIPSTQERAIHLAAAAGVSTVSLLIQRGADPDARAYEQFTPLFIAVRQEDKDVIRLLLRHGVDPNVEIEDGSTALLVAVTSLEEGMIEMLVAGGADVNAESSGAVTTPLHTAVEKCRVERVMELLRLGADPNKRLRESRRTPLHTLGLVCAELKEELLETRLEIAGALVESGAELNSRDSNSNTPLQTAIDSGYMELAKGLVGLGSKVDIQTETSKGGKSTLFHRIVRADPRLIGYFLDHGADFNAKNKFGRTPYHEALAGRLKLEYVKEFVRRGCPYNQCPRTWERLSKESNSEIKDFLVSQQRYLNALKKNNLKLAEVCVNEERAVPSGCGEELRYPVHWLAYKGFDAVLRFVLEKNVPPNRLNCSGQSPLYVAARFGRVDVCRLLMRYGACFDSVHKKCPNRPVDAARKYKHVEVEQVLARVRRMFRWARSGDVKVVKKLESRAADDYWMYANVIDRSGQTLLGTALGCGHGEIAQAMLILRVKRSLFDTTGTGDV